MRYIHGKDWDAKLIEALVAERMKPNLHADIPNIELSCKYGHSSIENLVLIKTWRSTMWLKLNCETKIYVVTSVGESEAARIFNTMGQGSFGAALASSLNIALFHKYCFTIYDLID